MPSIVFQLVVDHQPPATTHATINRQAARAIIHLEGGYLLLRSPVYGDIKFPGGGVEQNETLEAALIREVKEETGRNVILDSIQLVGIVEEKRMGLQGEWLHMTSHYFTCAVDDLQGERNLDPYEQEKDYQVLVLPLEAAIKSNKTLSDLHHYPWIVRDNQVMELWMKRNEAQP